MDIELPNKTNGVSFESTNKISSDSIGSAKGTTTAPSPIEFAETKHTVDEATGLLQAIVTEKISAEVIRKIPADEYLELLSLLDEMISGSVDKRV